MTDENIKKPIAWRIVHPSGSTVYVDNKDIESMVKRQMPGCTDINCIVVSELYRSNNVVPLYEE